jgi:hypothetical protein
MQQILTTLVLGANRYRIDGQQGGAIYLLQPGDEDDPNTLGLAVHKVKMPYDLFDQLKEKHVPGVFQVLMETERGGQESDSETVVSVKGEGKLSLDVLQELFNVSPTAKASAKVPDQPLEGATVALVLGASRYELDNGAKGGSLVVAQKTSGRNDNQLGFEIIRFAMPYDLFGVLKDKGLPGEYKLLVSFRSSSRFKARLRVDGLEGDSYLDRDRLLSLFRLSTGVPPAKSEPASALAALADKK